MTAVIPPRIERGQTIGVVAPAGPVRAERLARGLERLGDTFRVRLAPSLASPQPRPPGLPSYLAHDDDVRASELEAMLADPDVRAVILARGGYGIMRILPRLDASLLRRDPKPIVGFSDGTALLAWAHAAGVRGIHGPVIAQLSDLPADDVAHLVRVLTDPRPLGPRPWSLRAGAAGAREPGDRAAARRGPLVTANLTLATALLATPWRLPLEGAIAMFEEIGERPYELDRYLTQLALAGELSRTAAVIVGDLTRCEDPRPPTGEPDPDDAAISTVLERLHSAGVVTAVGAPIGHGARNEAVPFAADSVLDTAAGVLEILDGAVA